MIGLKIMTDYIFMAFERSQVCLTVATFYLARYEFYITKRAMNRRSLSVCQNPKQEPTQQFRQYINSSSRYDDLITFLK